MKFSRKSLRVVRGFLLGALVAFGFLCAAYLAAYARPPAGSDPDSARAKWFRCQAAPGEKQGSCCSEADGHELEADEVGQSADGAHYTIKVQGQWFPVPDKTIIKAGCGPNPTAHAVVWYTGTWDLNGKFAPFVLCFLPGWGF